MLSAWPTRAPVTSIAPPRVAGAGGGRGPSLRAARRGLSCCGSWSVPPVSASSGSLPPRGGPWSGSSNPRGAMTPSCSRHSTRRHIPDVRIRHTPHSPFARFSGQTARAAIPAGEPAVGRLSERRLVEVHQGEVGVLGDPALGGDARQRVLGEELCGRDLALVEGV